MDDDFARRVLEAARRIPEGRVATSGQLAYLAGRPRNARQAGRVMARCGDASVPCHRVVHADGSLCPGDDFGVPGLQRHRLLEEGVPFRPDGRVDLAACRWLI